MMADDYVQLEGRLRGPLYSSRLYRNRNHLLRSTIAGFHEEYRRFAWEDIQAFTIRKTGWGGGFNLVCGIILFALFMSFATWHEHLVRSIFIHAPFFLLFLVAIAVNTRRGPTCSVRVQTAVSEEWLGSLHRIKVARRVLGQLGEIVHAKQVSTGADGSDGQPELPAPATLILEPNQPWRAAPKVPDRGRWHQAILFAQVGNFAGSIMDIRLGKLSGLWTAFFSMFLLLSIVACIGALASQSKRTSSAMLRAFGWTNLGYHAVLVIGMFMAFMLAIADMAKNPGAKLPADIRTFGFYRPMIYTEAVMLAALIIFGAVAVLLYRPAQQVSPPAVS